MIRANDAEDAVNIANGTEFGLGNSIFGSNFNQVNQIADQLQSGNVAINDLRLLRCAVAICGIKQSGYGKFGGEEGLTGLCNAKSVIMDKPLLRLKLPQAYHPDYPIENDKRHGIL